MKLVATALAVTATVVAATTLAACGTTTPDNAAGATGAPARTSGTGSAPGLHGTVTVLAAASLTESFDHLKAAFEQTHPGVTVEVSYGSSATLVQQANAGAPASVLALAGTAAAKPLNASLVKSSKVFASNVLEIAVPPNNPAGVTALADLAKPSVKVVVCADTVPCGKAAQKTFTKAHVIPNVVSKEIDVKATLAKVRLGEADAAIVYHSDVVAAKGAVKGIEIDKAVNTKLEYPVITLTDDAAAQAFAAYVASPESLQTFESFGLGAP